MAFKIKIKVVGIGGSGCNAISRMKKSRFLDIDLIAINTDAQDLKKKNADFKLRIGRKITNGLGAGMNPNIGKKAAEEQKEEIIQLLKGADIIFITTGLGGGTGSGAAPVIAEMAMGLEALTIGVVTTPFSFEGSGRIQIAKNALRKLREKTDSLILVSNDNLLKFLEPGISLIKAFQCCDEILWQAVKGISDLVLLPGIVNVNFADVKSVMKNSGTAFFGTGTARGDNRAVEAARSALSSSLLDISISKASGILFNVSGDSDISLYEINEAAKAITKNAGSDAKVIFGAVQDEKLKKGTMKVTVIATGF